MARLADEARKERLFKLMKLCLLRGKGTASEDRIAQELDFRNVLGTHSAEAMYERLKAWGLPDWVVYPDNADQRAAVSEDEGKKRKARSSGEAEELPPAARAFSLFDKDLKRLNGYIGELHNLVEELRGELFVSHSKMSMAYQAILDNHLARAHGFDGLPYHSSARPKGATARPWEGLYYLIAMHALMNESVNPLIDELHPRPHEVDRADLYKDKHGIVTMLRTSAEQLAIVVRGGNVRQGRRPGEVSEEEAWMYWFHIRPRAEKGYSSERIYKELKEQLLDEECKFKGERYTLEDVKRLKGLGLEPPDDLQFWFPEPPPPSNLDPPPPFD